MFQIKVYKPQIEFVSGCDMKLFALLISALLSSTFGYNNMAEYYGSLGRVSYDCLGY